MNSKKGSIYLLKVQGADYYKIGYTAQENINNRINELQTGNPYKLIYIHHSKVQDAAASETWLHSYFAARRVRGEWFHLLIADVQRCLQYMHEFEDQYCLEKVLKDSPDQSMPIAIKKVKPVAEKKAKPIEIIADWYRWLPGKDEVIAGLEETEGNLAFYVKNTLKKTEADYNRKAKGAIVQLLVEKERIDLMEKLGIDPADYNL